MSRKKKEQPLNSALQSADTTSRRALVGGIVAAVITAAAGIIVAFINGWFTNEKPKVTSDGAIYRVRVTVLDAQGIPIDDADEVDKANKAKVWSSVGGEAKKVEGGWQFDINKAAKPLDGELTFYAEKKSAFLKGKQFLKLNSDYNPAVTISLKHDDKAEVRGQVRSSDGRAISGVRVFVIGYESEAAITGVGGNFFLKAHAAHRQRVRLYAEKKGYRHRDEWHDAGDTSVIIVLYK